MKFFNFSNLKYRFKPEEPQKISCLAFTYEFPGSGIIKFLYALKTVGINERKK